MEVVINQKVTRSICSGSTGGLLRDRKPRLLDQLREALRSHPLGRGCDIRSVQELPGHTGVKTTMIYTHLLNRGGKGVRSPVDDL